MSDNVNHENPSLPPTPPTGMGGSKPNRPKFKMRLSFSRLLMLAVIVLLFLFIWTEYNRRNTAEQLQTTTSQLQELQQSTSENTDAQAAEILNKVRALMDIPSNPIPTVATISDVDRLKEANEFFNVAQNGDYLILTARRAILYDEERNVILDVAPFQVTQGSPAPTTSPTEEE